MFEKGGSGVERKEWEYNGGSDFIKISDMLAWNYHTENFLYY
jgi:hypothetical protein